MLTIRRHGDPVLHTAWDATRPASLAVAAWMLASLDRLRAIGIAANQVGLADRFFVHGLPELPPIVVDPEILATSSEIEIEEEGCLSLPGEPHLVARPLWIDVEFSVPGAVARRVVRLTGYPARVACHEIDHLNGRTIRERRLAAGNYVRRSVSGTR